MNYIIVEDEKPSAERLKKMVSRCDSELAIEATFDSVSSTVRWLRVNKHPGLAFFDIQLSDGLSFEIFEQVEIDFPVIFTTAFNEYAIKAFKVNSIDYLLKPIDQDELATAIKKFRKRLAYKQEIVYGEAIANALSMLTNTFKTRFVVKVGEYIRVIKVEEIALFISSHKATFLRTIPGRDYGIDQSLDQVTNVLDPSRFFRVGRKYIVALSAITDIVSYSSSRLKLKLSVPVDEDVIVSREKVTEFKNWLDG